MRVLWEYDFEHDNLPCRVLFEVHEDGELEPLKWFLRLDGSALDLGDDIKEYIYNLAIVAYDEEQELYKEMRIAQQEEHDEFWNEYLPEVK